MKKNHINLLVSREDYQKYENYFERLKLSAAVFAVIFFILFISFYIVIKNKFDQYEKMNLQKTVLLQQLTVRRNDEAKIDYIEKKYNYMKAFLKDDAYSTPYYQLLSDAIRGSSESASLKSFEVNKNRLTLFTVVFTSFESLMDFLKFAESPTFIKYFENITLQSFVILGQKEKKASYELSFNGKFIPIKVDLNQ